MTRHVEAWKLFKDLSRSNYWYIIFTYNGKRYKKSTKTKIKNKALKIAEDIYLSIINNQQSPGPPIVNTPIVSNIESPKLFLKPLFENWLLEIKITKSQPYYETVKIYVNTHWLSRWHYLEHLTTLNIQRYIAERLDSNGLRGQKLSTVTLAKELSTLKQFLKWCRRHDYLYKIPEWMAPKPISNYIPIFVTREQMIKVLNELPSKPFPIKQYYTLMWATALRKGTLARLKWNDINLEHGTITIRTEADKNRKARVIPLIELGIEALKSVKSNENGPDGLVFGKHDFRTSLRKAALMAGIKPDIVSRLSDHSIRHSRISDLATYSKNLSAIMYLAGHKQMSTTMRYIHSNFDNVLSLLLEVEKNSPF